MPAHNKIRIAQIHLAQYGFDETRNSDLDSHQWLVLVGFKISRRQESVCGKLLVPCSGFFRDCEIREQRGKCEVITRIERKQ
jgi:hypothetical protein